MKPRSTKKADTGSSTRGYRRAQLGEGERGKYLLDYRAGTNVVLLDADVAAVFDSPAAVNEALRSLIKPKTKRSATKR